MTFKMVGSGGIMVLELTLHVYPDGLDGSHPDPILSLAVVPAPLHPLNAVDAKSFIEYWSVLKFVRGASCRLSPPHL